MTTNLDKFSQFFVDYAASTCGYVLEIGAAYGVATLAALKAGARVVCNDIDPRHLAIVKQEAPENLLSNLQFSLGMFPCGLDFPSNSFDAILICRVLHFFDGQTIEFSLKKAYGWLKPGGKIFIVADTPYMKNWESFIPEYEKRVARGEKWPGLMLQPQSYEKTSIKNLPSLLHPLDDKVLTRVLLQERFFIEQIEMFDRYDFPPDRRLDGRESVGVVAIRK